MGRGVASPPKGTRVESYGVESGARLSSIGTAYCLLLQGRVVPLVTEDEGEGEAGGGGVLPALDHFPDAHDIANAAAALEASVIDLPELLADDDSDDLEREGGGGGD